MPSPARPVAASFSGTTANPEDVVADVLFIPLFEREDLLEDLPSVNRALGGELNRAVTSGEFRAKLYHPFVAATPAGEWKTPRVIFVGAGKRGAADAERVRRIAAACGYIARQRSAASAAFLTRGLPAAIVADGLSAAEFHAGTYKTEDDATGSYPGRVLIVAPGENEPALSEAVRVGRITGESANLTRSLANEPGNILTPREFAARTAAAAAEVGLSVEVLDENRLREMGMRLLLGVAQGSAEPPRLIVIRHDPPGAPATPVLCFVGKGVTFDSGGISIKPADGMDRMKDDMAGGAAVIGAMRALALLGARHKIIGLIPTVENMPSGRATRPGDVIAGASGTTVEVINTDAEGRLILADALWYARQLGATHLIDIATLTGACVVALGRYVTGLFGSPDAWVDTVRESAARAGDRVWPMPIYEETEEELRSEIADLVNSAGRPGGAITAAAFLKAFAGEGQWAHLDIAGTAWAEVKQPYQPKGATGVAVRLLIDLALTAGRQLPA
jgi:leucyl aminopeptidase